MGWVIPNFSESALIGVKKNLPNLFYSRLSLILGDSGIVKIVKIDFPNPNAIPVIVATKQLTFDLPVSGGQIFSTLNYFDKPQCLAGLY